MIRYCLSCKIYTLKDRCPKCGKPTIVKKPARFNINNDYSKQRLRLRGLI